MHVICHVFADYFIKVIIIYVDNCVRSLPNCEKIMIHYHTTLMICNIKVKTAHKYFGCKSIHYGCIIDIISIHYGSISIHYGCVAVHFGCISIHYGYFLKKSTFVLSFHNSLKQ